ncbi:hypothetical protein OPQ81_008142 [Rhizoctonia solani]|nr:hypothetical protein OPQ81_008142 [Rhizoctonia solani]
MEARYSKLSYLPYDSKSPPRFGGGTYWKDEVSTVKKSTFSVWVGAVWTLVVYFILSVGVSVIVPTYAKGRHFNVTERTPFVHTIEGTRVTPFRLMQSDIVTFLSSIISVLKCALAAWAASLCWYVALFLMERRGLARRDLKTLLKYGLRLWWLRVSIWRPAGVGIRHGCADEGWGTEREQNRGWVARPDDSRAGRRAGAVETKAPTHSPYQLAPGAYSGDWSTLIIGALLAASLVANFSSPILTGSVSWVPSNRPVHGLPIRPVEFGDAVDGSLTQLHPVYYHNYNVREAYVMGSVGKIGLAWGREADKGAINSTIGNVTLPYFQVHSIEWIEHLNDIPGIRDGATPTDILHPHFQTTPTTVSGFPFGYAILVPNTTTDWSTDSLDSRIIHDTRLLILFYAYDQVSGIRNFTSNLPSNAYTLSWETWYYAFAWVTFSAGIGNCKEDNCVVSSPSTIRNNTPVELEPHQLTFQALSMAPVVGVWLVNQNTSLPYPWNNINDYVEAVLVRSYSGAWGSLNANMATSTTETGYVPSLPSLLAYVDNSRSNNLEWFYILNVLFLQRHAKFAIMICVKAFQSVTLNSPGTKPPI